MICSPAATAASLLMVGALITDLSERKVPNLLTVPGALAGMGFHLFCFGVQGLSQSLCGLAVGCLLLIVPFVLGGTGGGDVKLLGALGAWLGPASVLHLFLYCALVGGLWSLISLVYRRLLLFQSGGMPGTSAEPILRQIGQGERIPYTVPMALGFVMYMIWGRIPLI